MPELLTPGVIIQEVDHGPQPIEGVSTSTAGLVGETTWGPTSGPPLLVTSVADFERKFGGPLARADLPRAVRGFFENGGRRAYVARVAAPEQSVDVDLESLASDPTKSRAGDMELTNASRFVRLLAPPRDTRLVLSSVVGLGTSITFIDRRDGSVIAATVQSVEGATGVVTLTAPAPAGVDPDTHDVRVGDPLATPDRVLWLRSRWVGEYANRLSVSIEPHLIDRTRIVTTVGATLPADVRYVLERTDLVEVGAFLQLEKASASGGGHRVVRVESVDRAGRSITTSPAATSDYDGGRAHLVGWRVTTFLDGQPVEVLEGIPTRGFADRLDASSAWLRVQRTDGTGTVTVDLDPSVAAGFPSFPGGRPIALAGGRDGNPPGAIDVLGSSSEPRSGLAALEAQDGINLLAAPGFVDPVVVDALIGQAERRQDRFAVVDGPRGADVPTVLELRAKFNSRYAAMYHPWLRVRDPLSRLDVDVPPSGHVLGCYARTDAERGVFKAPANVVIRGITGFTTEVPEGEQDILNPEGVNVLRQLDGLGRVIWGARTMSAEGLWKYVPVRRLFIFLEQSIVRGTRFAVFEPNDHRLWGRLRDAVTNFLTTQWREGALFGEQPEQAFFVRIDDTTTTQDDRDNGRVNILVGIAPVKPAEFIVFRIGQAPSSVIIAETA